MRYARWWYRAVGVAATLGVGLAMLEWSALLAALALFIISGIVAMVLGVLANEMASAVPPPSTPKALLGPSWMIGSVIVTLMALIAASPALALLFVIVAIMSSPWLVALLKPRKPAAPAPPRKAADEQAPGVAGLNDEQLCCLWRHTFWDLLEEVSVDTRLRLVALREACLEEMERRNPVALAAWLESGARASGSPERFWRMTGGSESDDGDG